MVWAFLFVLGLALGSFIHVLASRYEPDRFLLTRATVGGRSHCPHCRVPLRWHELVPLLSFLLQRGRCRRCKAAIGWSYFWVELVGGALTALVPWYVIAGAASWASSEPALLAGVWTAAFLVLLAITLIDLRLYLIPDELVVALAFIGGAGIAVRAPLVAAGPFAGLFGLVGFAPWANHLAAAAFAVLFFGGLVLLTRGRGMGMGDVKLGAALGLLFGWPAILLLTMAAFVIGAVAGVGLLATRRKTMKSAVPFGPFLALGAAVTFFFGHALLSAYLGALGA